MCQEKTKELHLVRDELPAVLSRTNPTEEFRAQLLLTMISVSFTAWRMEKTQNPEERRLLIYEGNRRRDAFTKGVRLLQECSARRHQAPRISLG
jgi:hypothetical protein